MQAKGAAALLLLIARTEQGFRVRSPWRLSRTPVDLEGLALMRLPPVAPRQKATLAEDDDPGEEES